MSPQPTVLVVDHDPLERGSNTFLLQKEGYLVDTAKDGPAALKKMEKYCFDVVLTNLRMPGMSGLELLKEMKERKIDSLVIIATQYGWTEAMLEAVWEGVYDFIELGTAESFERLKRSVKSGVRIRVMGMIEECCSRSLVEAVAGCLERKMRELKQQDRQEEE